MELQQIRELRSLGFPHQVIGAIRTVTPQKGRTRYLGEAMQELPEAWARVGRCGLFPWPDFHIQDPGLRQQRFVAPQEMRL